MQDDFSDPIPEAEGEAREARPPGGAEGVGEGERAQVKWFDAAKGYGFVLLPGRGADAFLHASCLGPHGASTLQPGAELTCEVGDGERGLSVRRVVSIDGAGSPPPPGEGPRGPRPAPGERRAAAPSGPAREVLGTVKFFNANKGFGFVTPDDGDQDVFLPGRVLTRCGIVSVRPEQRLRMRVRPGPRGPSAESVEEV